MCKNLSELNHHKSKDHNENNFIVKECDECGKQFDTLHLLNQHKTSIHSGEQTCEFCGDKF